jgi:uncharacterized protein (DUF427 family)
VAYKVFARYWSVEAGREVFEDLAWSLQNPMPGGTKVAGLVAFFNEKTDIIVDGERQERPTTQFS